MSAIWNDLCCAARRLRGPAVWLPAICGGAALALAAFRAVLRNLDLSPDSPVFAYAFAGSLAAGVAMALAPALSSRGEDGLHEEALPGPLERFAARKALMVVRTTVSVALVIASGLFIRGLQRASAADVGLVNAGFEAEHQAPRKTVLKLAKHE